MTSVFTTRSTSDRDAAGGKGAIIVVSHVDVPPPRKDECIAALNPLAEASRKGGGNQRFEVVQQTSRPNHFTVIEAWKDRKATTPAARPTHSASSVTSSDRCSARSTTSGSIG